MCQLTLMLEWRRWHGVDALIDHQHELARASRLATCFHALDIKDEAAVLPCTDILHETASCLVDLFGPAVGQVILTAELDRLALPAYRRRALVLAAAALVTRTLLHAFRRRSEGQIVITLGRDDPHHALFLIEDDGCEFGPDRACATHEIVAGLTALLEADVVYRHSEMGGTAAEVRFPIASTV
ncbi:MAG: ATP-binding protein [Rhodospirillales bacterium]|nr:ATP-binding protein [Rhodospirillales bacterium]